MPKYTSWDGGYAATPCRIIHTFQFGGEAFAVIHLDVTADYEGPESNDTFLAVPMSRLEEV